MADYGVNAAGVNRNGPGLAYGSNGPAVDEQYGIYWPPGYSYGNNAFDKIDNNDSLFKTGRLYFLESEYHGPAGVVAAKFVRNSTIEVGANDTVNIGANDDNIHDFGSVFITAKSGVPMNQRLHTEQVLLVDTVVYNSSTNKTTIGFQTNAAGNQVSTGSLGAYAAWVLDANSKYYYTRFNNTTGYGNFGVTTYAAGTNGYTTLTAVATGDYTDGISRGTPMLIGGEAHNDWIQGATRTGGQGTTAASWRAAMSDNMILSANTWLGRPSSLSQYTMGDGDQVMKTFKYNADGTVNTATGSDVPSYLVVEADSRHFHTTDGAGNPLPVLRLAQGYPINVPLGAAGSTPMGSATGVLAYNNTNATITDPNFGTFDPGYGVFTAPLLNQDGSLRGAYGGTNGLPYKGSDGTINNAVINNLFILKTRAAGASTTGSWVGGNENSIWVGNTQFGAFITGGGYNPPGYAAGGSTMMDNILSGPLPYTPDWLWQGNSMGLTQGSNPYPANNTVDAGMSVPDQANWAVPFVPPLFSGITQKATSTLIRKFDRYGLPVIPGVSPPGAMAQ